MNKYLSLLTTIAVTLTMLCSCLSGNDDDIASQNNDTMITSFTLNTVYRTIHVKTSDGRDSTYVTSMTPSSYKFSIDHLNGTIQNPDSLPKWTNPAKVLCTVTTGNSAIVGYKRDSSDTIYFYNSADTMDFTKPVEFRVIASDGSGVQRKYIVSLNIHQEEGDSIRWENIGKNNAIAFDKKKLYSLGNTMYLMGVEDSATTVFKTSSIDGTTWEKVTTNVPLDSMAYNNTVIYNNQIYTLANGTLYKSADAATWTAVSTPDIETLIAAGSTRLFGIGGNKMKYSNDGGVTWADDSMSDDASFLPKKNFSYVVTNVKSNAETERIVIAGNLQNEADNRNAMVWSKVIEKRADSHEYSWTRVVTRNERHGLPYTENLNMVAYGDMLVSMNQGNFLISTDNGMVWNVESKIFTKPEGFNHQASELTMAVDVNNWLWFVDSDGNVWKARINRLAWKEVQKAFLGSGL